MIQFNYAIVATFTLYLLVIFAIGYMAYKKTKSSSDYFLGDRNLGPWPAALSAGASDMSGWLLLGLPGYAFLSGFESLWLGWGLLIGTWLNWLLLAKRLRVYTILADNSLTIPQFLTRRFEDSTKIIQIVSALFILLFFLFYTSSGLVAGGKLFETVFGIDYTYSVIIGTICVLSYTMFGGFLAVSWTDLVQGLLMAAALIIVPIIVISTQEQLPFSTLSAKNPELLTLFRNIKGEPLSIIVIVSLLAWGLGYFGQPHILARFKATRSNSDIKIARRIAVSWSAISMIGAIFVGLSGIIYVDTHLGGTIVDSEKIFMILVNSIFHPVVAGILLAAILAAIMSTADSQLLVSSSALAEDLYKELFKKSASSQEIVFVGRIAVVLISIIALFLALNPKSSVLGLVSYAWAGFGAAFGPVIFLSLYWKRMNKWGALAGIVSGGLTVVIWKQLRGGIFDLYEIVPGVIIASVSIFLFSLITKEPEQSVVKLFQHFEEEL